MSLFDSLRYRWRVLTGPRAHETELAEEVEFHLDLAAMQREHAGRGDLSTDDARSAARRQFGNRTYYREDARRASGLARLDTLAQDIRFGLRTFRRAPTFTVIAVLTLAIGIGANAAIFSAIDALILRPLPFPSAERLMSVSLTLPAWRDRPKRDDITWSVPQFNVFKDGQTAFSDAALWMGSEYTLRTHDDAFRDSGEMVSSRYFQTLGIRPALGRVFTPDDDRPSTPRSAVISDELWHRAFGGEASVLGRTIDIDGSTFAIIGVAPPTFRGLSGAVSFWFPIAEAPQVWGYATVTAPGFHSYFAVARLVDGVSPERALSLVQQLGPRVDAAAPMTQLPELHFGVFAAPLDALRLGGNARGALYILFGAVGLVLLVACANVAGLFLARAAARRREIAVRLALGAGRGRLVRQLLVESATLALFGGIASLIVARAGVSLLSASLDNGVIGRYGPSGINTVSMQGIALDRPVFAFTAALALATGILFGLLPALQSTRPVLTDALASDSATSGRPVRRRVSARQALTVLEIAAAVVLLAGSGLLVRSLGQLLGVRPGFDASHVLTMRINRAPSWSRDSIGRFYDLSLARIARIPGVTTVALSDCPPLGGGCGAQSVIRLNDRPIPPRGDEPQFGIHWITPDWPASLRVPLIRGRLFTTTDGPKMPSVALINEAAARAYWPGQDPIGRTISTRWNDATSSSGDTLTIVGILGDVRHRAIELPPAPELYVPYHQQPLSARMMFFIRTSGDPAALTASVRAGLREVAPGFPVSDVETMEARAAWALSSARFGATLLGAFAAVALVLAAIGTYGVVSFGVAQRTREIGVRVALGATARDVVGMVVGQGMILAAVGGALGLVGALATTRLLRSQLYDVRPNDPITLVSIVALLLLAVLVASWIPARRAAGVPAVEALRGG